MSLFRVTIPGDPIVSVPDMKTFLRVEVDLEDKLIKRLIGSATNAIERAINQRIMACTLTSTFTAEIDGDYTVAVEQNPLMSITASGSTADIVNVPLTTSVDFVNGKITITALPKGTNVVLTAVVGMTDDPTNLDATLVQAVMSLTGYWYENRDAADIPASVLTLVRPFKRYVF